MLVQFQQLALEVGGGTFDLRWHHLSGHDIGLKTRPNGGWPEVEWPNQANENPPYDPAQRITVGQLCMPIGSTDEESTFGFGWVTLPRNDTSDGLVFERAQTMYFNGISVWERFYKLSEQAGGLLPPPIMDGLMKYSPLVTASRASRWYALLFYLCGDAARQQSGRVAGERELTIPTPHWDSVTAIQRCRLNTEMPCLPHDGAGEKLNQRAGGTNTRTSAG